MQIQLSWLLQKPADLNLHCLQRQGISGSAGQGLMAQASLGPWNGLFEPLRVNHSAWLGGKWDNLEMFEIVYKIMVC